jgi:glycosyltransferase involved in cell wall biosynthesis
VVTDYLLIARFHPRKAIAHIREIPTGLANRIIGGLVKWSHAALFFNSKATAEAFSAAPGVPTAVVYNGFEGPAHAEPPKPREDGELRLLILGRINSWKGQDLLVEAVSLLPEAQRRAVKVKVVGDAFEGQPYRRDLETRIAELGLGDHVSIEGFVDDPTPLLQWSDAVVIPSRKPEPFGRVAIEGMAWARPVIAARHGGLVEIVEDGQDGVLFEPNNAADLRDAIMRFAGSPEVVASYGVSARKRFEALFTSEALMRSFCDAMKRAGFA